MAQSFNESNRGIIQGEVESESDMSFQGNRPLMHQNPNEQSRQSCNSTLEETRSFVSVEEVKDLEKQLSVLSDAQLQFKIQEIVASSNALYVMEEQILNRLGKRWNS
mgnify:CR=1 FL=1